MSLTSLSQTHLCHWLHWVRLICVIDIEESGLVVKLKQWSQNQQFKVLKTPQSKKNILPIFKGFFLQLKKMQFQTVVSPVFLFLVQTHLDPKNYWQNSFEDVYLWDRWVTLHGVIDFAESLTLLWHWYRKVVSCMWHQGGEQFFFMPPKCFFKDGQSIKNVFWNISMKTKKYQVPKSWLSKPKCIPKLSQWHQGVKNWNFQ